MTDSEAKALSMRIKRSIAREIETGVDNPIVADLRKIRREISRECGHDLEEYARYTNEQSAIGLRKHGLCIRKNETGELKVMPLEEE